MPPVEDKKAGNAAEACSRPVPSETKTPKSLKPVTKIIKKSPNQNSTKKKVPKATPQVQSKDEKKSTQEGHNEKSTNNQKKDGNKKNLNEQIKEKSVNNEGHNEKNQSDQKNKEKLGGLILMCNRKTKPDCFQYKIMGVSKSKKDLVLGIKPGLKLFLYDFDLKLLYGIYSASSAGGIDLESKAFGGAFPVQVRFKVYKDCFPLPEDTFKKAIKDNYNDKQKFKCELTFQQVKKLVELFKPVEHHHSNAHSFMQASFPGPILLPPPMPTVLAGKTFDGREEPLPQTHVEPCTKDPYYYMAFDQDTFTDRETTTSTQKESISRDALFLSEKEYRAYGLARAQHTSALHATASTTPTLDTYLKDYDTERLPRHPSPSEKEAHSYDPLFLSEKEYRSYGLRRKPPTSTPPTVPTLDPSLKNTYYPYHPGASYSDTYPQKEATSSEPYTMFTTRESRQLNNDFPERGATYHSPRRAADEGGNLYSTYASNALSEYNQRQHVGGRSELASTSVSSRYSFMGPSLSYR